MRLSEILDDDDEDDAFLHKNVDKQRKRDEFFRSFMDELYEFVESRMNQVIKTMEHNGITVDGRPLDPGSDELPIYFEAGESSGSGKETVPFIEFSMRKVENYGGPSDSTIKAIKEMGFQDLLTDIGDHFGGDLRGFEIDGTFTELKKSGFYNYPKGKGFFDVRLLIDWDEVLK